MDPRDCRLRLTLRCFLSPVVARGTAHGACEDAMELRVTSKSSLQCGGEHGLPLPRPVDVEEPLHALSIAEIDEGKAGLLMEEAAQSCRAESGTPREDFEREGAVGVANQARGALHCRVHIAHGHAGSIPKRVPCKPQGICKSSIGHGGLTIKRSQFRQKKLESLDFLLSETPAQIGPQHRFQQNTRRGIRGQAADSAAAKDRDPHAKVGALLHQHVFLFGKQPQEISAANLIPLIANEIGSRAARDQVQFQLRVGVATIRHGARGVLPHASVEFGGKIQFLAHATKNENN